MLNFYFRVKIRYLGLLSLIVCLPKKRWDVFSWVQVPLSNSQLCRPPSDIQGLQDKLRARTQVHKIWAAWLGKPNTLAYPPYTSSCWRATSAVLRTCSRQISPPWTRHANEKVAVGARTVATAQAASEAGTYLPSTLPARLGILT